MSKSRKGFCLFAALLNDDYAAPLEYDEETGDLVAVHCPECGEPIYFEDWYNDLEATQNWTACPVCETAFD